MPVISFLNKTDLTGKEIYPFNTSEGSGAGRGPAQIEQICTGATVHEASEWKASQVSASQNTIMYWAKKELG